MNYVPIVLSPVADVTPAATDEPPCVISAQQEIDKKVRSTVGEQHRERLGQLRARLQEHLRGTLRLPPSPSPSPNVARVVEFTPTVHQGQAHTGDDAKEIQDLLFTHAHRYPTARGSLRLSVDLPHEDHNQQHQQINGGAHRVESTHGVSRRGVGFVDDKSVTTTNSGEPSRLFQLECAVCAANEHILIDSGTPFVAYCPFCGYPQS
ncbi:hypothetical protein DQ04_00621090 [Trypanosoma grayi]|uniref:hypothetical protein n=1 Tax=Trypanosoma grayi TaxID=71804 RepID=UPI0004F3F028|nr:hypothetical protein DQ04_00621090 [Trypanosoma grayi]KEG14100.1 hypothetical protein DQ04_00621090 [Trypanosoma grayi]